MDIPYEIFLGFIIITVAMSIIGVWKKIPLMMFIGGALITFLAILTDNIIMGIMPLSSVDAGATTTYNMIDNPYPFTEWPKIMFAVMGSVFMLAGALVWKTIEE